MISDVTDWLQANKKVDIWHYVNIERYFTEVTAYVYSNPERTDLVGSFPVDIDPRITSFEVMVIGS